MDGRLRRYALCEYTHSLSCTAKRMIRGFHGTHKKLLHVENRDTFWKIFVRGRRRNDLPSFPQPAKVSKSPFLRRPRSSAMRMSLHSCRSSKRLLATICLAATTHERPQQHGTSKQAVKRCQTVFSPSWISWVQFSSCQHKSTFWRTEAEFLKSHVSRGSFPVWRPCCSSFANNSGSFAWTFKARTTGHRCKSCRCSSKKQMVVDLNSFRRQRLFFANRKWSFATFSDSRLTLRGIHVAQQLLLCRFIHHLPSHTKLTRITSS